MNGDYAKYLLMMAAVICGAAAVSGFLLVRKRQNGAKNRTAEQKNKPVDCGNISVFSDTQGNITIIPYVSDLFGDGKPTSGVTVLKAPYSPKRLGGVIRNALASCRKAAPIDSAHLMKLLEERSWKVFSKGKRNLSIYYRDGLGIVFNTTVQTSNGAFVFLKKGAERSLPACADDESIGNLSLDLLKRCR